MTSVLSLRVCADSVLQLEILWVQPCISLYERFCPFQAHQRLTVTSSTKAGRTCSPERRAQAPWRLQHLEDCADCLVGVWYVQCFSTLSVATCTLVVSTCHPHSLLHPSSKKPRHSIHSILTYSTRSIRSTQRNRSSSATCLRMSLASPVRYDPRLDSRGGCELRRLFCTVDDADLEQVPRYLRFGHSICDLERRVLLIIRGHQA